MAFAISKYLTTVCRSLLLRAKVPSTAYAATICSISLRDPSIQKPKPWPYETKGFNLLHWYLDSTLKRFDENTKIIVVEGNIGAGKTAFAKHIAETFGMKYIPEPDLASTYITPYGYDLRELDHIMPPSFKSMYIDKFYKNPYDRNVPSMQFRMLALRYYDYIDAMEHLLNTGQGIVMERCVFSDYVFLETMTKAGYISKKLRDYYFENYESGIEYLTKPHLIIYLDVEPSTALQRIKERNREAEVNSSVLTEQYIADIEHFYKQHYLKEMYKHSELLIYDWNNFGDMELVEEDIERIDFDNYDRYDTKLKGWRFKDDWEWGWIRREYTDMKERLHRYIVVPRYDMVEVAHTTPEVKEYQDIIAKVPGMQYTPGFNPCMGDSYLFKLKESRKYQRDTMLRGRTWSHYTF